MQTTTPPPAYSLTSILTAALNKTLPFALAGLLLFGCGSETSSTTPEVKKSAEASILTWQFGSNKAAVAAAIAGTNITAQFPWRSDLSDLTATATLSAKASIQPDPKTVTNYTSPKTFTVTAEDGTANTYTVRVTTENAILSWSAGWRNANAFTATKIDHNTGAITIDVDSADFDTKVSLSAGVALTPNPNAVSNWTNAVSFTASKGSATKTYQVKVTVKGRAIIKVSNANIGTIMTAQRNALGETADFNHIDVSGVTSMDRLFFGSADFNGDISKWDVSKVRDMYGIFFNAIKFNQDISKWNVSSVQIMQQMLGASRSAGRGSFNQPIGEWNVSSVTNMVAMFQGSSFNKDISSWNVSNVTTMENMFFNANLFNQDIGSWDVSRVINMRSMFEDAEKFNQDISGWDVSNVKTMERMFYSLDSLNKFNQNLSGWNVSKVASCSDFSRGANAFTVANKPKFTECTE